MALGKSRCWHPTEYEREGLLESGFSPDDLNMTYWMLFTILCTLGFTVNIHSRSYDIHICMHMVPVCFQIIVNLNSIIYTTHTYIYTYIYISLFYI